MPRARAGGDVLTAQRSAVRAFLGALAGPVGGYRRGLRFVFASEVKADTDKSRALLKTVRGRSFQVVANLKWRPVAPRAFDLGRAELLSYDTVIRSQQELQFAQYPHFIGLAIDAVFKDAEAPAAGAEYLEEPRDDLFAEKGLRDLVWAGWQRPVVQASAPMAGRRRRGAGPAREQGLASLEREWS